MRLVRIVLFTINLASLVVSHATANEFEFEHENNEIGWQDGIGEVKLENAFDKSGITMTNQTRRRLDGILDRCETEFDANGHIAGCVDLGHYCKRRFRGVIYVGYCKYIDTPNIKCCYCEDIFIAGARTPWTEGMIYNGETLDTEPLPHRMLQYSNIPPQCFGDPHFKTWAGEKYDFHGVCDLVLLHNSAFRNGVGMDIHIRTKKTRHWSYVSSAVLRIDHDTLEVMGGKDGSQYWINGVKGDEIKDMRLDFLHMIAGYPITYTYISEKSREFSVAIGNDGEEIVFKTWNAFVRVELRQAKPEDFKGSIGLLGKYPSGIKVARDSSTVINDMKVFGQEWQVLEEEPKLFHVIDGPQSPSRCDIPSTSEYRRRLSGTIISREDAELACARIDEDDFDLCVFDVMATNDKNVAGAY